MTRPLAVTGFSMLITLALLGGAGQKATGAVCLAALAALLVFIPIRAVRRDGTLPTAALSVSVAALLLFCSNAFYLPGAREAAGKTVRVSGTLCDLPYESGGSRYYLLRLDRDDGKPGALKMRLSSKDVIDLQPCDRVSLTARAFLLGEDSDEVLRYYKSKGLFLGAYRPEDIRIERGAVKTLSSRILKLRQALTRELLAALPGADGGVTAGLCFGDKTHIPPKVKTAFTAAGISHLLAVSGLHLSVWSAGLFLLLRRFRVSRKGASAVSILFIVFFAVLTGLNPPALRAGTMLAVVYAANLFRREADSLNSVGLALTGMLLCRPYLAFSLSLWLSVLATLGLILLMGPLTAFPERALKRVRSGFLLGVLRSVVALLAVSFSVTLMTLPVYLLRLTSVSVFLLPSNLLTVTAGSLCMTCGGLAAGFSLCGLPFLGQPLMLAAGCLAHYLIRVTSAAADLRWALMPVGGALSLLSAAAALIVFALFVALGVRNRRRLRAVSLVLAAVFLTVNLSVLFQSERKLRLTVADVGDGTAVVLRYEGRTAILGCGGNYYAGGAVCDIMSEYGSSFADLLLLPSAREEAASGAKRVLETFEVRTLYIGDESLRRRFPTGRTRTLSGAPLCLRHGDLKLTAGADLVRLEFGEFKAVCVFSPEASLSGERGDLLVCCKTLPKGVRDGDFSVVVLSAQTDEPEPPPKIGRLLLTSQNGNISFAVGKNGKMKCRRG